MSAPDFAGISERIIKIGRRHHSGKCSDSVGFAHCLISRTDGVHYLEALRMVSRLHDALWHLIGPLFSGRDKLAFRLVHRIIQVEEVTDTSARVLVGGHPLVGFEEPAQAAERCRMMREHVAVEIERAWRGEDHHEAGLEQRVRELEAQLENERG